MQYPHSTRCTSPVSVISRCKPRATETEVSTAACSSGKNSALYFVLNFLIQRVQQMNSRTRSDISNAHGVQCWWLRNRVQRCSQWTETQGTDRSSGSYDVQHSCRPMDSGDQTALNKTYTNTVIHIKHSSRYLTANLYNLNQFLYRFN